MKILSVGEVLWDLFLDSEHLGGAPLNFAFHAARLGHDVAMASAVGADPRGEAVMRFLCDAGISTEFLKSLPTQPTGVVRVQLNGDGQPRYRMERPAAYDHVTFNESDCRSLKGWNPDWLYFGTLFLKWPGGLEATRRILACCPSARRYYDVNLRHGEYTPDLVRFLAAAANILKLNDQEVGEVGDILGLPTAALERFASAAAARFGFDAVCVTRGAEGCAVFWRGQYLESPGYPVQIVDTVGAGDAFAAAFLHGWNCGWTARQTAEFANRVGALVASRAGGTPVWSPEDIPAPASL